MKLRNAQIKDALDCMSQLCGGTDTTGKVHLPLNRLPIVASLKAARTRKSLAEAWEICEEERHKLIDEYGVETGDGKRTIPPETDAWNSFWKAYSSLLEDESEINVEPITLEDLENGYYRDPESGHKDSLDISPVEIGVLIDTHIVLESKTNTGE